MEDDILPPNIEVQKIYWCRNCKMPVALVEDGGVNAPKCSKCNNNDKPSVLSVHVKENLGAKSGIH